MKIIPGEVLIFNKDNNNGHNELIASVTFINDYKDPIAFKVSKINTTVLTEIYILTLKKMVISNNILYYKIL